MSSQPNNIDELLKARAEIDSALRQHKESVSILFTDVVGSTAYFDRYGDTASMAMLFRHSELASSVVEEFQGTAFRRGTDVFGDAVNLAAHKIKQPLQIRITEENFIVFESR